MENCYFSRHIYRNLIFHLNNLYKTDKSFRKHKWISKLEYTSWTLFITTHGFASNIYSFQYGNFIDRIATPMGTIFVASRSEAHIDLPAVRWQ